MKVLLTNVHLQHAGGTETWTRAMAGELKRRGHEVYIQTFHTGRMSDIITYETGAHVAKTTQFEDFDLVLVNHIPCFEKTLRKHFRVFTSHSFFLDIEKPPKEADEVVAVTEEIQEKIEKEQGIKAHLIRNGISTYVFKPNYMKWRHKDFGKKPEKEICDVLYLSNHGNKRLIPMIEDAIRCTNVRLTVLEEPCYEIQNKINDADVVITIGRGILESLACEKHVVSLDWRDWMEKPTGAGAVSLKNFDHLKTHAFSGRNMDLKWDSNLLRRHIFAEYKPDEHAKLRKRIIEEFDIEKTVPKYLNLIHEKDTREDAWGDVKGQLF